MGQHYVSTHFSLSRGWLASAASCLWDAKSALGATQFLEDFETPLILPPLPCSTPFDSLDTSTASALSRLCSTPTLNATQAQTPSLLAAQAQILVDSYLGLLLHE